MTIHNFIPCLIVSNPLDGWQGTKTIVIRALVQDILTDGQPFEARVTWERDDGVRETRLGLIAGSDTGHLVWDDGTTADYECIEKIEV